MPLASRCLGLALVATLGAGGQAQAQGKPVRIVNPFAAGGNTDLVTRALIERLIPITTQQYLVENRPGARGGREVARVVKTVGLAEQ